MEDFTNVIFRTGMSVILETSSRDVLITATIMSLNDKEERNGSGRTQRQSFSFITSSPTVAKLYKRKKKIIINYNGNPYLLKKITYSIYSGVVEGTLERISQESLKKQTV